jgi:predicted ATPase/DNA-binding SARP family transcriptional activator
MAVVDVELLGRLGVRIAGERVELKGRQPALLAALAIAAPRPVAADTLADAIWGDDLPADPANALQQRISALRQTLDTERAGQTLVTVPGGYALQVDDERIDGRRFARLAAEGRALLAAGDHAAARERLVQALRLWYGPAFAGVADEPWAVVEAHRLRELRLAAIEDRIDADLALGFGPELVGELTELVAEEPLRERLCGQLMRALYRADRQGEALARYDETRRLLVDELGVDPGPALQRIHLQILDQADDLEVTTLSTPRRARPATNLPARTRPVIGRETVIERVGELLAAGRLVTLTGPGGAGKTTVAIEAARRQPPPADGVWLVELAALSDGRAVPDAVAAAVGIGTGGIGGPTIDLDVLVEALADRALLLVLDNCEHLVADVARLAQGLLGRAAEGRVLATSREPLAVDGELVWSLPTLRVPEADATAVEEILTAPAVQLLVERIRAHDPTFMLDATGAAAASAIARRLDGIPLAIELAAARSRVLALPDLAVALDDRFAVLSSTRRDAPSRQRTLRGAIDWSWDLLEADGRTAWAALAVPVGGADRTMAASLLDAAGLPSAPLDVLEELVDRSLLSLDTSTTPPRYRMLESLRAYGHERLRELGLDAPVHGRHAVVVADALDRCHDDADPAAFGVDLDGLSTWLDEARAALHWASRNGHRELTQRIAGRLGWLWLLRGLATEGLRWLDEALGAVDGAPPEHLDPNEVDVDALLWASGLRATGADPHASAWAARSVAARSDPARQVLAEVFAAVHRAHAGDVDAALRDLAGALEHARAVGGWPLGFVHVITAQMGRIAGRIDDVREHAQTALTLLTDAGVAWAQAQAIDIVVDAIDPAAEPARARRLATEGLELCRRRGFPELEGRMLLQLGAATHASGDTALARSYLEEAVELTAQAGSGPSLGFALLVAGAHARERGELEASREQLDRARELLAGTAMPYGSARAALELGRTLVALGDIERAAALTSEAVRLARDVADPDLLAQAELLAARTR